MSDETSPGLEATLRDLPTDRLQSILSALRLLAELPPEEIDAVTRAVQQTGQPLLAPDLVARALRDVLAYRVSALAPLEAEPVMAQFEGVPIRRAWHQGEWYFSVVDVCAVLADTERPRKYWDDLKRKLREEGSQLSENIGQLKMQSTDGKFYRTDAANREQLLRIIQSIPSPKAEPFKRWLARLGREHLEAQERPAIQQQAGLAAYLGQDKVEVDDARAFFTDLVASTLAPDLIRQAEAATSVRLNERVRLSPREFFALLLAIAELIRKQWPELPSGAE